jgi:hypothetical protein
MYFICGGQRSGAEAQRAKLGVANGGKARRILWENSSSYSKWLNKGVKTMTNELEELQQMKKDLNKHIHLAETVSEREKLADLRNEIAADRVRAKELNARSYQVALANQSKIKFHLDEAEKLRLESVDLSVDAWSLENLLKSKQIEFYQLERTIKESKNSV